MLSPNTVDISLTKRANGKRGTRSVVDFCNFRISLITLRPGRYRPLVVVVVLVVLVVLASGSVSLLLLLLLDDDDDGERLIATFLAEDISDDDDDDDGERLIATFLAEDISNQNNRSVFGDDFVGSVGLG